MSTFNQITAMQKLTETLAREDLLSECADAGLDIRQIFDCYIEEARLILRNGKPKRQRKADDSSLPKVDTNPS